MKKSIIIFLTAAILLGFALDSNSNIDNCKNFSNKNINALAALCPKFGTKYFSLFWSLITTYLVKDNVMFEETK